LQLMVKNKSENGISIKCMALASLPIRMVILIMGTSRVITKKDMELISGLVETDLQGNTYKMPKKVTEYSHGQMEIYIKDNGNKIIEKVMHISNGLMAINITDSGKMI